MLLVIFFSRALSIAETLKYMSQNLIISSSIQISMYRKKMSFSYAEIPLSLQMMARLLHSLRYFQ